MAVVIETTIGDITVDLYLDQRPVTCLNFLKLCKMKYYNFNLFHMIRSGFIAQTGDPTGEGSGGNSVWGILEGPDKRFFAGEKMPKIRHSSVGLLSMVCTDDMMIGSQFFFTLSADLDSLDGVHCVIGEVTEGHEVLRKLNEVICDENYRPYQDVRITHTVVLEDPFNDPAGFRAPSRSPSPSAERLKGGRIAPDEEIDEMQGKSQEEIQEMIAEREAKAQAIILEMVGDLPDADIAPPENVLFVCKLNPVTTDEDLEIIFCRFGKIVSCEVIRDKKTGDSLQYAFIEFADKTSCENAYFKMDNVLIDDRRIHVDFSQSVSKIKWLGKGRGVKHINDEKSEYRHNTSSDRNKSHYYHEDKNDEKKKYESKSKDRRTYEKEARNSHKTHREGGKSSDGTQRDISDYRHSTRKHHKDMNSENNIRNKYRSPTPQKCSSVDKHHRKEKTDRSINQKLDKSRSSKKDDNGKNHKYEAPKKHSKDDQGVHKKFNNNHTNDKSTETYKVFNQPSSRSYEKKYDKNNDNILYKNNRDENHDEKHHNKDRKKSYINDANNDLKMKSRAGHEKETTKIERDVTYSKKYKKESSDKKQLIKSKTNDSVKKRDKSVKRDNKKKKYKRNSDVKKKRKYSTSSSDSDSSDSESSTTSSESSSSSESDRKKKRIKRKRKQCSSSSSSDSSTSSSSDSSDSSSDSETSSSSSNSDCKKRRKKKVVKTVSKKKRSA